MATELEIETPRERRKPAREKGRKAPGLDWRSGGTDRDEVSPESRAPSPPLRPAPGVGSGGDEDTSSWSAASPQTLTHVSGDLWGHQRHDVPIASSGAFPPRLPPPPPAPAPFPWPRSPR